MQRGSIINFNNVGRVSCLLLLAIVGLAISPVASVATYAQDSSAGTDDESSNETTAEPTSEDSAISTYSTEAPSDIQIGFRPTTASNTVTPVDGNISSVYADVVATVTLVDTGGYSVYLGTNKDNTLRNGDHTITPISESDCNSGVCDLDNIPINKWGYSFQEVQSDDAEAKHTEYQAVPYNLRETALDSGKEAKAIQKKYALSFAANVNSTTASGTYTGSVTMSVVSSPRQVVFDDITTMQQMSTPICTKADIGDTKQLEDARDGKYYWVTKMADGKCWMTQNLDLDLFASDGVKADGQQHKKTVLTSKDSNVTADWSPSSDTIVTATTAPTDDNGQLSWSLSGYLGDTDYYTANPDSVKSCGTQVTNIQSCSAEDVGKWTKSSVPKSANNDSNAHRLLGNFYQWGAATAGATTTSVPTADQDAPQSICPYGWRLPTSGENGEFQKLSNELGATKGTETSGTVSKLTGAPFYAVRGGYIGNATYLFDLAGNNGGYWSSTASSGTNAYILHFNTTDNVTPSTNAGRRWGRSVRCINDPDI